MIPAQKKVYITKTFKSGKRHKQCTAPVWLFPKDDYFSCLKKESRVFAKCHNKQYSSILFYYPVPCCF